MQSSSEQFVLELLISMILVGTFFSGLTVRPIEMASCTRAAGYAASSALAWNKTYGGAGSDFALALVQTVDGGYALAGSTTSFGAGSYDFWLVRTDVFGNMLWNRTYGGAGEEKRGVLALVQTVDGGYALAGCTYSYDIDNGDFWLVKTDASGSHLWNKTYGGAGEDRAYSVVQTVDGGYALAGSTTSFGAGTYDFWLVKTDASGNHLWNKTYGGASYDDPLAFVQTVDGGYALAGRTYSFGAGNFDFWLVKTDSSGNMLWNKTYGGTREDRAYSVVQTVDGGYALAGATYSFGAGNGDFWLVRTDAFGNHLWNKTHGGAGEDWPYALIETTNEEYALAGVTNSFGAGSSDFWLVKTDAFGNHLWNRTYGGTGEDYAGSMVQTSDAGYALAGGTKSFGAGSDDFWLVKTMGQESTIIVPDDYPTIQEAINNAIDGDTIYVKSGVYCEHVVVNKTLSLVGENASNTIVDGNNTGHVIYVISDNVSISGFTVQRSGSVFMPAPDAGICLNSTTNCAISENRLIDNGLAGISLLYSHQNAIINNNLSSTGWGGIHLMSSSRNTVSRNIITDKHGGVNGHVSSNYNNITENVISNCTYGGFWHAASYNNICGNNISAIEVEGIWLQDQVSYNTVAENSFVNNTVAIRVQGPNTNNTLSRNVIVGAAYGIKIESNARYTRIVDHILVDNRAGNDSWSAGIRLDSGPYSEIHSNTIIGNNYGVLLYSNSPYVSIYNNTIAGNEFGIRIASGGSNYLNVSDNVVMNNRGYGIGLTGFVGGSNYATITRNVIVNNSDGIALGQYSNYNVISRNNISENNCGFYIEYSTQNRVFANNVLYNDQQANVTMGSANAWDNGYPSGGNYWSDYVGVDVSSDPYQNETGSDGIGDTPYIIDQNNTDNYPLMDPWSPNAGDWTVDDDGPADFRTIQEAINAANGGDAIFVKAGIYYEHVFVNKTLSLLGEDASATIVDGSGSGNVFTIDKNNITITGFTIRNSGTTLGNAGMRLNNASLCSISGNSIRDNFAGLWLEESSENIILANNITANVDDGIVFNYSHNNTISGNHIAFHEYFGIVINWSHNNTICYNNVTQTLGPSHGDGINLWKSSNNTIFQNQVEENNRYGIRVEVQSDNNTISGNRIGNCLTGLQLYDSSNFNLICENNIAQCSNGIDVYNSRYTEIFNNTIAHNYGSDEWDAGVRLESAAYTVIRDNEIFDNWRGILLYASSPYVSVHGNNVTSNDYGIRVARGGSSYVNVSDNYVANNRGYGIDVTGFGGGGESNYATIARNLIVNNTFEAVGLGIGSSHNTVIQNNMTRNGHAGVTLERYSNYNTIVQNNIIENAYGICFDLYTVNSTQNTILNNNMINNTQQVRIVPGSVNTWDGGYHSGGNYWSDYAGIDVKSGPYQNEAGSDGIGDTPYVIDVDNRDRYPLMNPHTPQPDVAIMDVSPFKTVVGLDYCLNMSITATNQGDYDETFNLTAYANTTIVASQNVTLPYGNSITVTFTWNTTGFAFGNYTLSAYAWPIPEEIDVANNNYMCTYSVHVGVAGDVSSTAQGVPDGMVNMRDINYSILLFNAKPNTPKWNPNADVNNDQVVNMRDIQIAILNFNKHE